MPLDISRIRALCFDIDGTLSDTDDQFVQRLTGWLQPFRFLFSDGNVLPFARRVVMRTESPGTYLFGIPDRLGLDEMLTNVANSIHQKGLGKTSQPFLLIPGVAEMLARLNSHYPMAVISARGERVAQTFLNQFDLASYFSVIVTGQTCRHTKPYPDPVIYAARQMGVSPQACLMIGDTTVDIRAGKTAGAQAVGVLCGFGEQDELLQSGADLILQQTPLLADHLLPA